MVSTQILEQALPPFASDDTRRDCGAELVFHGRVRADEHGREIVALDYEVYPQMAARELRRVAQETVERFAVRDLHCWHRVGRVPVGESALRVVVWSRHRAEGLAALAWFIDELKARVPIWKWAVTAAGERYPSRCDHNESSDGHGG